jgi:triosephosphate isomerase (TIM)
MRTKLVCGNWKMNGTIKETRKLLFQVAVEWGKKCDGVEVAVCPPFTGLLVAQDELQTSHIKLGAQNCYVGETGTFTGEVSATMLADLGCTYVILGHSERRTIFAEGDELIAKKVRSALDAGLHVILCIGETESERTNNATEAVLAKQIAGSLATATSAENITIAYEPVWAIGTGKTATPEMAQDAHKFIRAELAKKFGDATNIRILYGGSVKPENARTLFSQPDIDGGLIGGASLDAAQFISIIEAAA